MLQISQGKFNDFHCTPAGYTALPLDNYALCGQWPARPSNTALYPISVRQVAALPHASFRHNLAVTPLRFATLHRYQVVGGLSPPIVKHAWRTKKKTAILAVYLGLYKRKEKKKRSLVRTD